MFLMRQNVLTNFLILQFDPLMALIRQIVYPKYLLTNVLKCLLSLGFKVVDHLFCSFLIQLCNYLYFAINYHLLTVFFSNQFF